MSKILIITLALSGPLASGPSASPKSEIIVKTDFVGLGRFSECRLDYSSRCEAGCHECAKASFSYGVCLRIQAIRKSHGLFHSEEEVLSTRYEWQKAWKQTPRAKTDLGGGAASYALGDCRGYKEFLQRSQPAAPPPCSKAGEPSAPSREGSQCGR